jgi:hypothetical protein
MVEGLHVNGGRSLQLKKASFGVGGRALKYKEESLEVLYA